MVEICICYRSSICKGTSFRYTSDRSPINPDWYIYLINKLRLCLRTNKGGGASAPAIANGFIIV